MRIENFTQLLSLVSWIIFLLLSWLLLLRAVAADLLSFVFLIVFFAIAFMASALNMKRRTKL